MIDPTVQRCIAVGLIGTVLVIARRWKNADHNAGYAVAGWTMFVIISLLLGWKW